MKKFLSFFAKFVEMKDFKGGVRTVAALLIGNSVVLPLLTNGSSSWWPLTAIVGIIVLIASSGKER